MKKLEDMRGEELIIYLVKKIDLSDIKSTDDFILYCPECWWRSNCLKRGNAPLINKCPVCMGKCYYFIIGTKDISFLRNYCKILKTTVLNKII